MPSEIPKLADLYKQTVHAEVVYYRCIHGVLRKMSNGPLGSCKWRKYISGGKNITQFLIFSHMKGRHSLTWVWDNFLKSLHLQTSSHPQEGQLIQTTPAQTNASNPKYNVHILSFNCFAASHTEEALPNLSHQWQAQFKAWWWALKIAPFWPTLRQKVFWTYIITCWIIGWYVYAYM